MRSDHSTTLRLPSLLFGKLPAWLTGPKGIWAVGAALYTAIYSAWIFVKWTNPAYELVIANLGYLPLGLFSVICAFYASGQPHLDPRTRRSWRIFAISLILLVMGDIVYLVLELTKGVATPDLPDFFYLAFYPLAFIGLITIPAQLADPMQRRTWKLDLAIIVTGTIAVVWYFLIFPSAAGESEGWAGRLVAGAYPVMDVILLASVASLLFRRSEINTRRALIILGAGLLIYVIADVIYAELELRGWYRSGSWVDIVWTVSYLLIGLAALRQTSPYRMEPIPKRETQTNWATSLPPFIVVAASTLTSLYAALRGTGPGLQAAGLYLGTVLTILLTILRQVITMRENSRLVDELNLVSERLRNSAKILEDRVRERTHELEEEANRLRLTAQIARDATTVRDLESLLKRSTGLIHERFALYHAGIYLLDQKREYAILTASSTELGQQLIADNYRLPLREQNIVAQAVLNGDSITTLDTGQIHCPIVPDPRSEFVLPLKVDNTVIGLLDVQSDQPQTLNHEDVAIMQVMADQLATAIERTRLLEELETKLKELESAYGQFTRENWKKVSNATEKGIRGYRFDNVRLEPINRMPDLAQDAIKTGTIMSSNGRHVGTDQDRTIALPIKLRDQTIGVVNVKLKEGYDQGTISILEAAVDRLASAMESARLYEEARLRADRELSLSRVTTAISASTEYEEILQTTVREIGNILSDTEVGIQILQAPASMKRPEHGEQ